MAIKVKATQAGYYEHYREPGHTFEIEDEKFFSELWMVRVDGKAKGKGSKGKPVESELEDEDSAGSDSDVI